MLKSYKYRIYPNIQQKELIEKTFSCCRLIYNLALETKIAVYKSSGITLSSFDLGIQLKELKKENIWLSECDSQAYYCELNKIQSAYKTFFEGGGFPKFKKKKSKQSFSCHTNKREVNFGKKLLTIPKLPNIKIEIDRVFTGRIKTVTISRTPTKKYYASIVVENDFKLPIKPEINPFKTIGIDLGIKSLAVTSNGLKYEANRYLKQNLERLKVLQRRAYKKKKGSNNRKKANLCVAKLHEKIRNQRTDYIHKVTTGLIRDNQTETFVMEDLNVVGMLKNRKLSQAISDVSFSEFVRQIKYKCDWYGKNLIQIGRFEPSTKTCSECQAINETLTLADRDWVCTNCNTLHDRDLNAAKNIRQIGLNKATIPIYTHCKIKG